MKDIKDLSLDGLFNRLHQAMTNLVSDIDSVIQDKEVSMDEIRNLRTHINYNLAKRKRCTDNQKLQASSTYSPRTRLCWR